MRFSSPLTFSKKGFYFKNRRYSVFFPWHSPFRYHTIEYATTTIPYKNSSKLQGIEYNDVISEWVTLKYPLNHLIILTNINVEAKNIQFWAKVPKTDMIQFVKDLVILHCQDRSEVVRLAENIPISFADAHGYSAGSLIIYNKDL